VTYEKIKVLVETAERSFRGYVHKPLKDERHRLSDHLNEYDKNFLCLSDVQINERGHQYRPGEQSEFIAIAINAITYVQPITD